MEKINVKNEIGESLNDIWQKYQAYSQQCGEYIALRPVTVETLATDSLLFIGLNPSIRENDKPSRSYQKNSFPEFYNLNQAVSHPYFKKFEDISEKSGMPWQHYDMLYLRGTKQAEVQNLTKTKEGTDFLLEQARLSEKILTLAKPKIIVVNNAFARDILSEWLGWNFEQSDTLGTKTHNGIPIFFTSMLTGQRALDLGSYERLIWHINFVKKQLGL